MPRLATALVSLAFALAACAQPSSHEPATATPSASSSQPLIIRVASQPAPASASPSAAAPLPAPHVTQPGKTQPAAQTPYATATPLPIRSVSPPPLPTPTVNVPALPSVPEVASDAMPRIIAVLAPADVVTSGETVTGGVIASSNVASVEVRIAGYSRAMEKIAPGRFTITFTVPQLPFFLRNRTYTIEIVARNTRGDAVSTTFPVTVR